VTGKLEADDLKRFAEAFADEAELRAAIVTLLTKMPGITGVQETHGTLEHGKDIVFYNTGAMGELHLNACVIKNSKISGALCANMSETSRP
jgi:hypothetical protein